MYDAFSVRRGSSDLRTGASALALAAILALTAFGGCGGGRAKLIPPDPPPDPDYLEQSSATNLLANLRTSYEKRNFTEFEKLFSGDFVFVFNPVDAEDPMNPTPVEWPRDSVMACTENLLTSTEVEGISLNWSVGDLTADDTYGWKIRVDDVLLDLVKRNESNEVWIYQVKGATLVFCFRETDTTTPGGHKKWVITRWVDSPIGLVRRPVETGSTATERTSWGRIIYSFR